MNITTSDIRKGLKIEMDGGPWMVVDFQFVKPGKGTAFTRTRIKHLITGNVVERTWRSGEVLELADVEEHNMQYLYKDGDGYCFMNNETYEQITLPPETVGDQAQFLLEQMECRIQFYKGRPVTVEIPTFVELQITYCEPGVRGNTATGTNKQATMSTGAQIGVPLFIEQGEWIKIDTRTGGYVERVKK